MNVKIQAVKFTMDDDQRSFVEKKFERINYAADLITDILFVSKLDKKFTFECTINFKGSTAHVSTEEYDFMTGVNKLIQMLDQKISKEKEKIKEKK